MTLEREPCPPLGFKNMVGHLKKADLDIEMFVCGGDKSFLDNTYVVEATREKFLGAIGHFERAELNYKAIRGTDANKAEAKKLMDEAYKKWSVSVLKVSGVEAQWDHARKYKLKNVPTEFLVE